MTRFHTVAAALALAVAFAGGARAQGDAASAPPAMSATVATVAPAATVAATPASAASAAGELKGFHIRAVDDAWYKALPRDADAATQAYMDRISPEGLARSNAYFEGGYWLQLWNFLAGIAVSWLILRRGGSARVRDWCQRVGRFAVVRDALYGAFWAVFSGVLTFPLSWYEGLWREQQYGMATQTFGPWFGEQVTGLLVSIVALALVVPIAYAVFRRTGERWWIWATGVAMVLQVVFLMVVPVWVEPLFNTYKPVTDPVIKQAVLALAKADGVPVDNVYEFDASRQTTRVSANVSGVFGTAAVRLNDNLLKTSLPEIRAVMGHELGHFVMNHIWKAMAEFAVLLFVGFGFAKWLLGVLLRRYGADWGVHDVADVATFPVLMAVMSVFFLLATPALNTMTRTQEIEADRFGLNLAREPLGEAEVDLKLTEYRKPDPSAFEEWMFYDHPSTRFRIHDAMRWRQAMGTP